MKPKEWGSISKDYFNNLTSPFEKGVKNPLFDIIKKIKNRKSLDVVDLGTGIGNFLPYLEKNFRSVAALDFSEKMLGIAKKKSKSRNTIFIQKDIRNLKGIYNKFDIAFAINSILMPSVKEISKAMAEARKVLKKNGLFIAVFPSLEAVLCKAMLAYEHELEKCGHKNARKRACRNIEDKKYDFILGFVEEEGRQKHYYKFEIEYRLKQAGFRNIKFAKVEYPWKIFHEKYFMKFKNKPKIWDWLAIAEK